MTNPPARASIVDHHLQLQQPPATAVDRFARAHDEAASPGGPELAGRYSALMPATPPGDGQQYAFEVDLDACSGCKSCVAACHAMNGLEEEESWRDVGLLHGGGEAQPVLQHWPLIVMLALTQMSVGAFLVEQVLGLVAPSALMASIRPLHSASALVFGLLALAVSDFEESDVIVFVGAHPCIAHPILWERVLRNPRDPAVVVVDPRFTETAMQATQHLPLRPKSDQALLYGVARILIERGWIDTGYVEAHTRGYEPFAAWVQQFTLERVAAETGLEPDGVERLAATIHEGERVFFWWTMGVNQSYQGVRTAQAIINLALLTGNIGRPGTGANSITGQCNAMGSRLFSNTTNLLGGHDFADAGDRAKVAGVLGIDPAAIPREPSWAYHEIVKGILEERIKGLWVIATNTAHSWINQAQAHDILGRLDFLVVQDMYASTETARMADLVLPAAAWGEKDGTFINSERRIGTIRKVAAAPGEALADFAILKLVAEYWGCGELFRDWTSPEAAFQILKRLSAGQPCDISGIADYAMLDERGGIQWPCPAERRGRRRPPRDRRPRHSRHRRGRAASRHGLRPRRARLRDGRGAGRPARRRYDARLHRRRPVDEAQADGGGRGELRRLRRRRGRRQAPHLRGPVRGRLQEAAVQPRRQEARGRHPGRRRVRLRQPHDAREEPDRSAGRAGALVLGSGAGGVAVSATEMPAETQVCQCNGVSKGDICAAIRDDGCAVVGDVKARTRAGTGCGGCLPLVTDLLKQELEAAGRKVSTDLCEHFPYTRQELLDIVKVREIKTFAALIAECGRGHGCEICKPAVSSMFASLWNENILDDAHQTLQDTNDRFLANMQRGGVYSVIPRVPGGEITPDKLIALGAVAKKYCARCARRRAGAGSTWGASPTSPPTAAPPSGTAGPRSRCSTSRRAASGTPPRTCAPTSRRSSSPAASSATRRGPPRSPAPSTRRSSGSTPARVSAGRATS